MAVEVSETTNENITARDDLKNKAAAAIAQIETDLETLAGTPSNAAVIAIVGRLLRNQKKIIQVMAKLL